MPQRDKSNFSNPRKLKEYGGLVVLSNVEVSEMPSDIKSVKHTD